MVRLQYKPRPQYSVYASNGVHASTSGAGDTRREDDRSAFPYADNNSAQTGDAITETGGASAFAIRSRSPGPCNRTLRRVRDATRLSGSLQEATVMYGG